ncbi:MAG TPA: hypothetical protein VGJ00_09390 [Rhabdochlamydiaceae bacterium]|jgi:hypothetical protein
MTKKLFLVFPAILLFFYSLFVGIDRFVHRIPPHFSLIKITAIHDPADQWDMPDLSLAEQKTLDNILNQSFTFFGNTNQAYLFLSEDHKFILKVLKQHPFRPKSWLAYVPLKFNPYYREYRHKREEQKKIYTACRDAFLHLKEETGLIYVHINPTSSLNKKIKIIDKNNKSYIVNLDKTSCYIQKRAQLIYPRLSELMRIGDMDKCKNIITSIFDLIENLGKKGMCDEALKLFKNFGLIEDKAVQLSIGKMHLDHSHAHDLHYKQDILFILDGFRQWLKRSYPELLVHFDEQARNFADSPSLGHS